MGTSHRTRQITIGSAFTAALFAIAASTPSAASANSSTQPQWPILHVSGSGAVEYGAFASDAIGSQSNGRCVDLVGDGGGTPGPYLVEPGSHTATIDLNNSQRPTAVHLSEQSETDNGYPSGRRQPLHPALTRSKDSAGNPTWILRFSLTIASDQDVWPEIAVIHRQSRCVFDNTDYYFHLRGA